MTLQERIAWCNAQGWDWETFESANDEMVLQAWPWSREMREWVFTLDGSQQLVENIYTAY